MKNEDQTFRKPSRNQRIERVKQFFTTVATDIDIRHLEANTATAALAAAVLGCQVAEIAKSIVFKRCDNHAPIIAVLCGNDRVCTKKLSAVVKADIQKADARYVLDQCDFEIGGVPPVAHNKNTTLLLENSLKQFEKIWAAAGSAHAVFCISPFKLAEITQARFENFCE